MFDSMRGFFSTSLLLILSATTVAAAGVDRSREFSESIRPALMEFCWDCHDPEDSKGNILFLDAAKLEGISAHRTTWRSVAAQLRNRTMPPPKKPQPKEEARMRLANWIDAYLRETACAEGPYAGNVTARRLNRLEYDNTIRDLVGVKLHFSETFPADSGGGEGFDNNGESLFLPPMLMERYVEAAQQIVEAAIVSPLLSELIEPKDLLPAPEDPKATTRKLGRGQELAALVPIYVPGIYEVAVGIQPLRKGKVQVRVKVDGIPAERVTFEPRTNYADRPDYQEVEVRLTRGVHSISVRAAKDSEAVLVGIRVDQQAANPSPGKLVTHQRLLGVEPGQTPLNPRKVARQILIRFVPLAFRRPIEPDELKPFLALYDRSADRGDPFEERMKLALKGVLLSPDFLFRIESEPEDDGIQPITDHEVAVRLSYFLWSTMPDEELRRLAGRGELNHPETLTAQVTRMLQDPRAHVFAKTFIGQWLGTKDVGGRIAPTQNSIQHYYTPEVAADMRQEVVLMFQHLLRADRSVLELIDTDYIFLSRRLAKFYQLDLEKELPKSGFRKVDVKDNRRGGLLGAGAVLALTSHFKKTSPVLRGAWVFDTLLGTPVPAPPPNIPDLPSKNKAGKKLSARESLAAHRDKPTCLACHNLIDPIGFGLENYDFLGRWRDEIDGKPVDASGKLPSGESFTGPAELRQVMLGKKEEFARNLSRKLLGYALGRGLDDRDECTISQLVESLENDDFKAPTLIREIVLSVPFRNRQKVTEGE
jgi:hypothetical protein